MCAAKSKERRDLETELRNLTIKSKNLKARKKKVDKAERSLEEISGVVNKIATYLSDCGENLQNGIKGGQGIQVSADEMTQNGTTAYGFKKTEDLDDLRNESYRLSNEITSAESKLNTAEYELNDLKIEEGQA